jgi:hypothetical protein
MTTFDTISQFRRMLGNLDRWIEMATQHAAAKNFEADVLAVARLAPDQFTFVQQVQSACDAAKFAAAYLSGKPAPSHPDTETTLTELRGRIGKCAAFLDALEESDFTGAEERRVAPPWMEGHSVRGDHYLLRLSVPNFYFHVTTAYDILRHNGVELGKRDFVGVKSWTELPA